MWKGHSLCTVYWLLPYFQGGVWGACLTKRNWGIARSSARNMCSWETPHYQVKVASGKIWFLHHCFQRCLVRRGLPGVQMDSESVQMEPNGHARVLQVPFKWTQLCSVDWGPRDGKKENHWSTPFAGWWWQGVRLYTWGDWKWLGEKTKQNKPTKQTNK